MHPISMDFDLDKAYVSLLNLCPPKIDFRYPALICLKPENPFRYTQRTERRLAYELGWKRFPFWRFKFQRMPEHISCLWDKGGKVGFPNPDKHYVTTAKIKSLKGPVEQI